MRLLDTNAGRSGTLKFVNVADSELGPGKIRYAILSHRWGQDGDEVTFTEIHESKDSSRKGGHDKLIWFCAKAIELGCEYG